MNEGRRYSEIESRPLFATVFGSPEDAPQEPSTGMKEIPGLLEVIEGGLDPRVRKALFEDKKQPLVAFAPIIGRR